MTSNDPGYLLRTFDELNRSDLYHILRLRSEVFVLEQDCAYLDLDDLDQEALHLYKKADTGKILAYARILSPMQCDNNHCSIGRVVVSKTARHEKLGAQLMRGAIKAATTNFPNHPLKISAQTYLTQFYFDLGFANTGIYYLEDQIPHQEMLYQP